MKISGFSMCRNAESLYYPIKESILSALPLVDEFVVAVGKSHAQDGTLDLLKSIDSPKLRILETEWDTETFPKGMVHAQQSDFAKSHCTGDWLLYLQADEVLHENDIDGIRLQCERMLDDKQCEGLLFNYHHFWGDYNHVVDSHGWYQQEVRVIRNRPDIHSWESAQSFRSIPDFDGKSYRQKEGSRKLRVARSGATVYHYGWVRPPHVMARKMQEMDRIHSHQQDSYPALFDYGALDQLSLFEGSHPQTMEARMKEMNWHDALQQGLKPGTDRPPHKHERMRYRLLTALERQLPGKQQIATFKNYELIR